MAEKSPFGLIFESRLIAALLRDRHFFHSFLLIFSSEYFVSEIHKTVCSIIQEFKIKYSRPPDQLELEILTNQYLAKKFPEDKAAKEYCLYKGEIEVYFKYSCAELEFVKDTALEFVKQKACQNGVLKCAKLIGTEKENEMPNIMQEALAIGTKLTNFGIDYFAERRKRALLRYNQPRGSNRIPFFIPKFDESIGGVGFRENGSGIPELLMFGGATNKGKSRAIGHMAKNAISLGYPGVIFSSEMSEDLYAERLDMSIGLLDTGELYNPKNFDELQRRLELFANQGSTVFIKKFPAGTVTIQETLGIANLIESTLGLDLKWCAWDHTGEFKANNQKAERRDQMAEIVRAQKTACDELECAGIGAFHLNREGSRRESAQLEDAAEDVTVARVADIIIMLNQTESEEELDPPEQRWVARKVRAAEKNQTVRVVDNRKRMLFVQHPDEMTDTTHYESYT